MIVEAVNKQLAFDSLSGDFYNTRLCVSVKPENEVFRFVADTTNHVVGGLDFGPVPYAEFSEITSGDGNSADTMTITLDGSKMIVPDGTTPDSVLLDVLNRPLRDRPIQVGLIALDFDTDEPIGLIPRFVGFIDNAPLTRSKTGGSVLDINCVSFRGFASRRIPVTYSDTDHVTRFPGDRSARHINDVVRRGGTYQWNSETGGGSGVTTGGGGSNRGEPFNQVNLL